MHQSPAAVKYTKLANLKYIWSSIFDLNSRFHNSANGSFSVHYRMKGAAAEMFSLTFLHKATGFLPFLAKKSKKKS